MHDVLRRRLLRKIESLPDEQVYQVLDFIEFLESKYAERHIQAEASGLQKFAEGLEDRMRRKAMNPATLREAFKLISAADRVLSNVSAAGRQIIDDLGAAGEIPEAPSERHGRDSPDRRPPGVGRPPEGRGEDRGDSPSGPGEREGSGP